MSTFKHIFLALTLALLGAASQPAMAVECQMQAGGQMACNDGKVYQEQTTHLVSKAPASSASNASIPNTAFHQTTEMVSVVCYPSPIKNQKENWLVGMFFPF